MIFIPAVLFSQSRKERKALEAQQKADQQVISNLKTHVQNLTSAQINGTNETYIGNQFQTVGLQPKGTAGYLQPFAVDDGKVIDPSTYIKINDVLLQVDKEYFPLAFSAEKKVTGMPAMALRERGVPWFADVKDWLEDSSKTEGNNFENVIKEEVTKVAAKGATALFLYNSGAAADGLSFNNKDKSAALPIPVIYITPNGYKKYFSDHSAMLDIELNIAFKEKIINGTNVIGFIDNAAPATIVVAAGTNEGLTEANTKSEEITKSALSDADNNTGEIAMLIELARMLGASKAKNNNYLFIALDGYNKGLTAGDYWLDHSTITSPVNYVINLNQLSGYTDGKKLAVQGFNSSRVWNEIFTSAGSKQLDVSIDTNSIIAGPGACFYKKEIPVLSFSAASNDYSTVTDAAATINYAGEVKIARLLTGLVEATDSKGKVAFAKIAQQQAPGIKIAEPAATKPGATNESIVAASKTSVSLGVIPDRANIENGLRISGVSPKKIASKLGLQPGDVLTNLGTYQIYDFKSYMQALTNFKTGDKTILRIKRGKDDKEFAVEF